MDKYYFAFYLTSNDGENRKQNNCPRATFQCIRAVFRSPHKLFWSPHKRCPICGAHILRYTCACTRILRRETHYITYPSKGFISSDKHVQKANSSYLVTDQYRTCSVPTAAVQSKILKTKIATEYERVQVSMSE